MSTSTLLGPAYVATDDKGNVVAGMQFTVWTAREGGTQITSLQDLDGNALPGYVTSDSKGRVRFVDPAGRSVVWLQPPGTPLPDRWLIVSVEAQKNVAQAITDAAQARADASVAQTKAQSAVTTATGADGRSVEALAKADQAIRTAVSGGDSVNVLAFGAAGDGVTDDTPAFQDALDALDAAGGGTLRIPPGRYLVGSNPDSEIRVPVYLRSTSPIVVEGYGATIVKDTSATFRAVFACGNRPGTTPGYGAGAQNMVWRGLRFEADFASGLSVCPFALIHAQNMVFEDMTFWQAQGRGGHIFDLGGCDQIRVRRCQFIGQDSAGSTSTVAEAVQLDIAQLGGQTSGTPYTAGDFSGLPTRDVTVEDCKFLPLTVDAVTYPCPTPVGSHAKTEKRYFEKVRILNNEVVDPRDNLSDNDSNDSISAYYRGVFHLPNYRDLWVIGNTITQTVPTGRPNRAISVMGTASGTTFASDPNVYPPQIQAVGAAPNVPRNIVIADNVIDGFTVGSGETGQEGIYIHGTVGDGNGSGDVVNVTIRGNVIRNGQTAGASNKPAVQLANVSKFSIDGNKFENYLIGVDLSQVARGSIVNCEFTTIYRGIHGDQVQGFVLSGNSASALLNELLQMGNASACTITGNTFLSPSGTGTAANGLVLVSGSGVTCVGNAIVNDTGTTQTRGIAVGGSLTNSVIMGNTIQGYSTKVSGTPGANVSTTGNV